MSSRASVPPETKKLATYIEDKLQTVSWSHCVVYEKDLERIWPLEQEDREKRIDEFAKEFGFRLRFYRKGRCAIFDKWPR